MLAITATNSATPSSLTTLAQGRVDQANREADQAEAVAQNLRAQASAAEQQAKESQAKAQDLAARIRSAEPTYSSPRTPRPEVPQKTQDFFVSLYGATSAKFAASGNPLKTNANAAPVRNALGQTTGRIVNLSV